MPDLNVVLRIRADLKNAVQQVDRLEKELRQAGRAGDAADRGARRAASGMNRVGTSATRAGRGARLLKGALAGFTFAYLARQAVQAVGSLKDLGLTFEALNQRFRFATGSVAAGVQELAFVRAEADRLGISFLASAGGYSKLAAAVRGTNITAAQTREIFLGVSEAAAVMRLSADQVEGAFRAIEQVASKGTVQAEELRGQLGERIPGAFQIAARAMGVTTEELNKMLEQGEVLADDFLPRFAAQLRREFAEGVPDAVDSAAASFARLGNAIERRLERAIANSSLLQFLARASDYVRELIDLSGRTPGEAGASRIDSILGQRESGSAGPTRPGARAGGAAREIEDARAITDELKEIVLRGESISSEEAARIRRSGLEISDELIRAAERINDSALVYLLALDEALAVETPELSRARNIGGGRGGDRARRQAAIAAEKERLRQERDANLAALSGRGTARFPTPPPPQAADAEALEKIYEQVAESFEKSSRRLKDAGDRVVFDRHRQLAELQKLEAEALAAAGDDRDAQTEILTRFKQARAQLVAASYKEEQDIRTREAETAERAAEREARAAERAAKRRIAASRSVIEALEDADANLDFASAYERAIVTAERWRDENLRALGDVGLAHGELADQVEEAFRRMVEAAEEQTTAQGGVRQALKDYAREAGDVFTQARRATENALQGMEDALVDFVRTGKLSFSDLANSIIADLARIAIRTQITGPLTEAFGLGNPFAVAHAGAIAGSPGGRRRQVDPRVFIGAPRKHGGGIAGLRSDEVPTILRKGEGIFTPEQMAALGGAGPREVAVRIDNRGSGPPQRVTEARATVDLRGMIVDVVTEDLLDGGNTARALETIVPGTSI